jgi:hypothetical protein
LKVRASVAKTHFWLGYASAQYHTDALLPPHEGFLLILYEGTPFK